MVYYRHILTNYDNSLILDFRADYYINENSLPFSEAVFMILLTNTINLLQGFILST